MNRLKILLSLILVLLWSSIDAEEVKGISPPAEALPPEVLEKLKEQSQQTPPLSPQEEEKQIAPLGVEETHQRALTNKITLNVKNMEIIDLLNILAKKGGLNIVASKNVGGKATIFLEDVSVEDALKIICEVNNLAYEKKNKLIKIITDNEYEQLYGKKAYERRILKIIEIKNAQSVTIFQLLNGVKSKEGKIFIDERTNKLIIFDLPEIIGQMEEIITTLDSPVITKVFSLSYVEAKKIESELKKILSVNAKIQIDSLNEKIIVTDIPDKVEQASKLIAELDKYPAVETCVFTLNYASPEEIQNKIKDELTKEIGTIKIDKRTNKVIVTDLPQKITHIKKTIDAYDEKTKEVLIEAKIIQVNLSDEFKFGIDWEYLLKQSDNLNIKTKFGVLTAGEAGIQLEAGVLDRDNYHVLLDALKSIGETKILSTPKVAVIAGEEAKILVGSNVPYTTEETIVPQTGNPIKVKKVTYIDVGIKLYVTPKIGEDGFITIKIKPEVSSVTSYRDGIPVVETSNVESEIIIKDKNTIIIAGLIKEEKGKQIFQVPILGNIPILNYLFKKTTIKKINTELVILLTPRIITGE